MLDPQENDDKDDDMSVSSTDSDDTTLAKREDVSRLLPYANRMCREIAIVLLAFAVAASFGSLKPSPPKTTKGPPARPFFPPGSVVEDWYRGEISLAIEKARMSDVAFVMYYAPWDAECQFVRDKFEEVARLMKGQASFLAVNCWHPDGECRNRNHKIYFWPVLVVYPTHTRGVQYNGPYEVNHMIKFLRSISQPLVRLVNDSELEELILTYDAVIVGRVNALHKSADYGVLYTTALRLLEKDAHQELIFAVNTHANVSLPPKLEMHLWNETWTYPEDMRWNPDQIINWILKQLHQVTMWSTPPGLKSREFLVHMQQRPGLVIFTPKNPLRTNTDYYNMLRQIGYEYYNCQNNEAIQSYSRTFGKKRYNDYLIHKELTETCLLEQKTTVSLESSTVISYSLAKQWINNSCCLKNSKCICDISKHFTVDACNNVACAPFPHDNKAKGECYEEDRIGGSLVDDRLPTELIRSYKSEKCRIEKLAERYQPAVFAPDIEDFRNDVSDNLDITGLACKVNASLALLALDSLQYYHFGERLGVDILKSEEKTAVVIIDEQDETHYVMSEPITYIRLKEFILNYTNNELSRYIHSYKVPSYTYIFEGGSDCPKGKCIPELTTESFFPVIMQRTAVVVLFHSKQCSFCQGVSHVYLTVSRLLSNVSLQFVRIDGDLNLLPWQFTVESYPTIIFFPKERKAESRVFPKVLPVTVENLLNFIVVNLDPPMRLQAMLVVCSRSKFLEDWETCIRSLRIETLTIIGTTLREWRNTHSNNRAEVLRKLQLLKQVHLQLAFNNRQSASDMQAVLQKLDKLRWHSAIGRKSA